MPCPQDIYAGGALDDVGQLQLLTSPLAATDEVLNLFAGGLVPIDIAIPSVLHAIGSTKDEIDAAVKKAVQKEDDAKKEDAERKEYVNKDNELSLQIKRAGLGQQTANTPPASGTGAGSAPGASSE